MRTLIYCVLGIAAATLWFGFSANTATAAATGSQITFPANGGTLGSIPDGPAGGTVCGDFGAPKDVTFTVFGLNGLLSDVRVNLTMTHTWVGDMEASLIAPGGAPGALLFKQTGGTTATACGDDSDMAGPYVFFDAAPAAPTWWNAATTAGSAVPVAAGSYRASAALTGANTTITPVFTNMTSAQINGTWTLRLRDGGEGDLGNVTAASLTLEAFSDPFSDPPLDINGDGKTDYVVVRISGEPNGRLNWFYNINGSAAPTVWIEWGLGAFDQPLMEDFDGDNKDDIAVYRSAFARNEFYILNSSTATVRVEEFGRDADDSTVVDDYDGDGKADLAVYRGSLVDGTQSTWFYRTAPGGPVFYVPWGTHGDTPMPGDLDGDGKADFTIRRNNGAGQGAFWTRLASGATPAVIAYGLPTDLIVPGDYDGDGKTDLCVARSSGGQIVWSARRSSDGTNQFLMLPFGSGSDWLVPGDYDGDGKTDIAVWRPNADPTQNFFYSLNSSNGAATIFNLGRQNDYPVAGYNVH